MSSSATFFRSSPKERMTSWSMVAIASHHDLVVGSRADDQVRKLEALLLQTQADERISFAEDFSEDGGAVLLGHAAI